jgi:hypothetical protein
MITRWWVLVVAMAVATPLVAGCDAVSSLFEGSNDSDDDDDDNDDNDDGDKQKKRKAKKGKQAKAPSVPLSPYVVDHLKIARQAAGCDGTKPIEPWCTAAAGFASGSPGKPGTGTVLGLATFVQTKGASSATLSKRQHLASLSFRSSASRTHAFLAKVTPDNATERLEVDRVERTLLKLFAGGRSQLTVSPNMGGYLDGLPAKIKYEAMPHRNGYSVKGGSNAELRRVGDYWVAVEVPRKNPAGIWFSVFHDAPYR